MHRRGDPDRRVAVGDSHTAAIASWATIQSWPALVPDLRAAAHSAAARAPLPFDRPHWRGRMHTWAFVAAIPAGLVLFLSANGTGGRIAGAVYAVTLALVFGTSAAYHRLTRTERSRAIMQRLDHSMIYLLIAGTYTPLCLVVLPASWGVPMLAYLAIVAAIGIVVTNAHFERMRRFACALYPAMVWAAVVLAPVLVTHLSATQLALIVAGVVTYSVGVPVLMHRRPDPWPTRFGYHEVWHVMTIVAAGCHFVAIHDMLS